MNKIEKEEGFSLLELVVVVGIVLLFSVMGVVGYHSILVSNKESAVEVVSQTMMNKELAIMRDWGHSQTVGDATAEWNKDELNGIHVDTVYDSDMCIQLTASWKDITSTKRSHGCEG